jgi:MFS family permease
MQSKKGQARPKLFYGWIIVGVLVLTQFSQIAETFNVLTIFLKPITEEFGLTRSAFAGAVGIGSLLGGLIALGIGPLLDRFGPRLAMALAFIIMGATFFLMAWMTEVWHFYALQVLGRSMNAGVLGVASAIIIPKWFIEKRGRAVALGGLGGSLGSSVTPLYVQLLVTVRGWRTAAAVVGILMWTVSMVPAALFLRRQPEDMGLLPDGATPEDREGRRAAAGSSEIPAQPMERALTRGQAMRLPSFYLLMVNVMLAWVIRTSITLHMIPYLTDQGLTGVMAVTVLVVHNAAGALGSLGWGFLAERFAVRLVLAVDFLLIGLALFVFVSLDGGPLVFLAWGIGWGVVQGGFTTLHQIAFADYYGRRHLGAVTGPVRALQTVAQAAGPFAAALAYDTTGSYVRIFTLFGFAGLAAALFAFLAKPPVHTSSAPEPTSSPVASGQDRPSG